MVGYVKFLKEIEEIGGSRFGDNPDPALERYECFLAEQEYRKIKSARLETFVKSEIPSREGKRKRTLSDFQYKGFYEEAINLSRNLSLHTEDKR